MNNFSVYYFLIFFYISNVTFSTEKRRRNKHTHPTSRSRTISLARLRMLAAEYSTGGRTECFNGGTVNALVAACVCVPPHRLIKTRCFFGLIP